VYSFLFLGAFLALTPIVHWKFIVRVKMAKTNFDMREIDAEPEAAQFPPY